MAFRNRRRKVMTEYERSTLISDAVYIINQLCMGFAEAEKIVTMAGKRIKPNARDDMVRLHLPQYLHDDSTKFIKKWKQFSKVPNDQAQV